MSFLKRLFGSCDHGKVKKLERQTWEHKCDYCNKVLFSKEEVDYVVEKAECNEKTK